MAQTTKRKHRDPISLLRFFNVRDRDMTTVFIRISAQPRTSAILKAEKFNKRPASNKHPRSFWSAVKIFKISRHLCARIVRHLHEVFEGNLRTETDRYRRFEFNSMPARKRQPSKRKAEEPVEATIDKKKENRGERILSLEHCSLVVNSLPSFRFKGCMLSALQIYAPWNIHCSMLFVLIKVLIHRCTGFSWQQRCWVYPDTGARRCWPAGSRWRHSGTKEAGVCEGTWWAEGCPSGMWWDAYCGPHKWWKG